MITSRGLDRGGGWLRPGNMACYKNRENTDIRKETHQDSRKFFSKFDWQNMEEAMQLVKEKSVYVGVGGWGWGHKVLPQFYCIKVSLTTPEGFCSGARII